MIKVMKKKLFNITEFFFFFFFFEKNLDQKNKILRDVEGKIKKREEEKEDLEDGIDLCEIEVEE